MDNNKDNKDNRVNKNNKDKDNKEAKETRAANKQVDKQAVRAANVIRDHKAKATKTAARAIKTAAVIVNYDSR